MPEEPADPTPDPTPPIVIIKRGGGHAGHHGGAWKVAYADFVTAMMSLFIVLWLMNSSPKVQEAVAGYFKDPSGYGKQTGSGQVGSGESLSLGRDDMSELSEKLQAALKDIPEFQQVKDYVQMTVTGEGLRVELLESETGMFFETGRAKPSQKGEDLLVKLAQQLSKLPNRVLLEGHTDARPFASNQGYTNWELAADRANAARRVMEASGLSVDQVVQVRGFADRRLRRPEAPEDASNRRVSIIVQYREPPPKSDDAPEPAPKKEAARH